MSLGIIFFIKGGIVKKNQKLFFKLLFLQALLQQSVLFSSAAGWVTSSIPALAQINDDRQNVVNAVSQNIGAAAADAIALLGNGAVSPQPYLNYSWLNSFATALSSGSMPYAEMNTFVLADLFTNAKSSTEYSYIINHLVPALQEMGNNLTSSADSLISTLNNVVITTINNNTQMSFDIYQGSNTANVGASNINLQPSIVGGGANSFYPGFKIGTLKPGVNNVALYGAAQGQGDILFVPRDGTGTVPTNGTETGSFRIHFLPSSQSSSSAYVCVQILPVDFPSTQGQQTQSMIQRTQCIDVSQVSQVVNLTLQIEDHMMVWAPAIPATSTTSAVQGTPPTEIDQSMIPMYYPSIKSMVLVTGQNAPFLSLPEKIAAQPILSSWINFINIIIGALQPNYQPGFIMTPNNIAAFLAQQNLVFLLKQSGNEFGDISKILPIQIQGQFVLPMPTLPQPSIFSLPQQSVSFGCAFAGLVGTQYLFTGDIPNLEEFELFLQMNNSLNNQQQNVVSLAKSITLSNIWPDLPKQSVLLLNNILGRFRSVKFVSISDQDALYTFSHVKDLLQAISTSLPSNGLLMYFLSTATNIVSFRQQDGSPVSFVMKDVIAHLQALIAGTANKQYMPVVGGMWGYVQSKYRLRLTESESSSLRYQISDYGGTLVRDLQANSTLLKGLLSQKQVSLSDRNGKEVIFNSFDVLQLLFAQQGLILLPGVQIVPMPNPNENNSNSNLWISRSLIQLWFSPTFTDGSFAELPLQAISPDNLKKLNDVLQKNQYAAISFEAKPVTTTKTVQVQTGMRQASFEGPPQPIIQNQTQTSTSYSATITVSTLGTSGLINVPVFSYTFNNLMNAQNNKTPIAKTAVLNGLNITYQFGRMQSQVVSVPMSGFVLVNNPKSLSPVPQKSVKAKG